MAYKDSTEAYPFPDFMFIDGFKARRFSFERLHDDSYRMTFYSQEKRNFTDAERISDMFGRNFKTILSDTPLFDEEELHSLDLEKMTIPKIDEDINQMLADFDWPVLSQLKDRHRVIWKKDTDEDIGEKELRGIAFEITREDFAEYYGRMVRSDYAGSHELYFDGWDWRGALARDVDGRKHIVMRWGQDAEPAPFYQEEIRQLFAEQYPELGTDRELKLVVYDGGELQIRDASRRPTLTVDLGKEGFMVYDFPRYQSSPGMSWLNPY